MIVAVEQVVALIAEDPEWGELRAPIGMNEQQEVETALLIRFEAELGDVRSADRGFGDRSSRHVRAVGALEVLLKAGVIERPVGGGM